MKRRLWLHLSLSALTARAAGAGPGKPADPDAARRRGLDWLAARQENDGWWRSRVYGLFRDGPTLTPHVAWALQEAGGDPRSIARGRAALAGLLKEGDLPVENDRPIWFPVYLSAFTAMIDEPNRAAWLGILRRHQFRSELGWTERDPDLGGWGYSLREPRPPGPFAANLSSTRIALMALAGQKEGGFDRQAARRFVERCQVRSAGPEDGGFVFHPANSGLNKAGSLADGRLAPYGSATADGLAALRLLDLPPDHGDIRRAGKWLRGAGDEDRVPGRFQPDRETLRESLYYYYSWSWMDALQRTRLAGAALDPRWRERAGAWADRLVALQQPEGSWANPSSATREDEPLVATAWAVVALSLAGKLL